MFDFTEAVFLSSVNASCFSYCYMEGLGGLLSRLHMNVPGCHERNLNFEAHMSTKGCRRKGGGGPSYVILYTGFCESEVHVLGTQRRSHTLPRIGWSIIPMVVSKTPSQKPSKDVKSTTFTGETPSEWGDCRVWCVCGMP